MFLTPVHLFWILPRALSGICICICICRYLSYAGDCSEDQVDDWPGPAGINQAFGFTPTSTAAPDNVDVVAAAAAGSGGSAGGDGTAFGWSIEGIGRSKCPNRFVSFPSQCSDNSTQEGATKGFKFTMGI